MAAFQLDTSGYVRIPRGSVVEAFSWSDLTLFAQGYVKAALRSYQERVHGDARSEVGFRHLAPATLAAMLKDCATFARMYGGEPQTAENGERFWNLRQDKWPGTNFAPAFPPLTLSIHDDGLIYQEAA